MSSTRVKGKELARRGYYPTTPISCVIDFLTEWRKVEDLSKIKLVLDPCAGGLSKNAGRIKIGNSYLRPGTLMPYPCALKIAHIGNKIITNDVRKNSLAQYRRDYLKWKLNFKPQLIIGNPPFYYAKDFILKALNDVQEDGFVVMLLRLNYFGGKEKQNLLWKKYMPQWVFVHSKRMSFWPDGGCDSIEYMHAVWKKTFIKRTYSKLKLIPWPIEEK